MYNLIIVDDEEIIRKGLSLIVNWNSLSFTVVGIFSDGLSALEYIRQNPVDAVLADILMPGLTGLDLASSLRLSDPGIKVVILSGYDSSCYARQAIDCNVFGYLLKPSRKAHIIDVMSRLKLVLDSERRKECILDEHRHETVVRCLQSLCLESSFECDYSLLPVRFMEKWMILCLVEPECRKAKTAGAGVTVFLKQIAGEESFVFSVDRDRFGILVCESEREQCISRAADIAQYIESTLPEKTGCEFSGSVGSVFFGISGLPAAFIEAVSLFGHRLYLGSGVMVDTVESTGVQCTIRKGLEKETATILGAAISRGDPDESARIAMAFFSELIESRLSDFGKLTELLVGLGYHLGESLSFFGLDTSAFNGLKNLGDLKNSATALSGMGLRFADIVRSAALLSAERGSEQPRKLMIQACSVIALGFQGNLGQEDVAAELGISPSYLSRLFKKEIGRNFKDYLTDIRFERAKQLLSELDYKVYEVAEMSGFRDQHYFCEVFKKKTGCTPLEYRERLGS